MIERPVGRSRRLKGAVREADGLMMTTGDDSGVDGA
jgi:hypothetical protein